MLTTFVYPHNVKNQVDTEIEEINREPVIILNAAVLAELRATTAFLEATAAAEAFLEANSRPREYTQDGIQIQRDELSRTEESITQVATDIPSASQRRTEARWFFE